MLMHVIDIPNVDITTATQSELEMLTSKYQLMSCLREEFRAAGFVAELQSKNIDPDFGIDLLAQMVLHKRANIPTIVGCLMHHFEHAADPAQACADAVLEAAEADFLDWNPELLLLIIVYNISDDVKEKLDMFQYPLPMVVEPEEVCRNRQTGYQTIKGSIILRDNHHEDDVCLDHINRMNAIPLTLNKDVVTFIQNKWKSLDKPKPDETIQKFQKRKRAFAKYDEVSRDVIEAIIWQGNRFWLTHKYDKRGRTYAQGYHINPMGNDWNKACVEFADAEPLNKE